VSLEEIKTPWNKKKGPHSELMRTAEPAGFINLGFHLAIPITNTIHPIQSSSRYDTYPTSKSNAQM
jgi:hypothetical protein